MPDIHDELHDIFNELGFLEGVDMELRDILEMTQDRRDCLMSDAANKIGEAQRKIKEQTK